MREAMVIMSVNRMSLGMEHVYRVKRYVVSREIKQVKNLYFSEQNQNCVTRAQRVCSGASTGGMRRCARCARVTQIYIFPYKLYRLPKTNF